MSETSTFRSGVSAYVLSSAASRAHGSTALLPVDSGEAVALFAPAVGNIPATATVESATLRVYQSANAWSGATTLTAQRVGPWKVSRVNWNNKPAVSGVAVTRTQTDAVANTVWEFDVTADVAAFVAGTVVNNGWQISSSSTARRKLRGYSSSVRKPTLEVVWSPVPPKPTDLRPGTGRAVSKTKPLLTFTAAGFTSLQVQIDPTGVFTAPTFDSGEVVSTVARFDLADSSYGGLTSGSTRWRVRVKAGGPWSAWSDAAEFAYAALPPLVVTAPGATTGDPAPPTTWTFGGTQTRFQLAFFSVTAGKNVYQSGWLPGADLEFTPPTALQIAPGPMRVTVWATDNVAREAVAGAPDYSVAQQDYTYQRTVGIPAVTALFAQQDAPRPWVNLTWSRTEPADQFVIERDGIEVARVDGLDLSTGGTSYAFTDWTAPGDRTLVYKVFPVVEGQTGDTSPTVTMIVEPGAVWLGNPDTGESVPFVFAGSPPAPRLSPTEVATVYETMDGRHLRHRHASLPATDVLTGLLVESEYLADPLAAVGTLLGWREAVGVTYRLVIGSQNVAVTVGDIAVEDPSPLDTSDVPVVPVALTYWVS